MPATCFDGPPRGAGVSAAALRPELAAALRGVVRYGARPSVSRRLVCTGGLKMHAQACRTAFWRRCLRCAARAGLLGLLVSYMPLARRRMQPQSSKQGDGQSITRKLFTLTQQISATIDSHRWRPSG